MCRASDQPGRIGSGVIARASRSAASTAFVDGRSTTAASVLVATSTSPVSSQRSTSPSSWITMTSSGVESISITSPGRAAVSCPNIRFGCLPSERRVRADPSRCRPVETASSSR
ncbi:hypothetical protein [Streptomyces coeruleorubidus]|uniref:hypothetical protein n=1 Tax=Streptomyces coeruleorubidus TaxID=116188 RepID=UPI0027E424DB|nr:hypothetical protein [Streptomyces coeruleorubidus]